MGKIARVAAHVKNVTADPVVFGVKFVGRAAVLTGSKVKSTTHNLAESIREEEHAIEERKNLKREAEANLEALMDEVTRNVKTKTAATKSTKTKSQTANA